MAKAAPTANNPCESGGQDGPAALIHAPASTAEGRARMSVRSDPHPCAEKRPRNRIATARCREARGESDEEIAFRAQRRQRPSTGGGAERPVDGAFGDVAKAREDRASRKRARPVSRRPSPS